MFFEIVYGAQKKMKRKGVNGGVREMGNEVGINMYLLIIRRLGA